MMIFWMKIIAFVGILAIVFGMGSAKLRKLIFRKGQNDNG